MFRRKKNKSPIEVYQDTYESTYEVTQLEVLERTESGYSVHLGSSNIVSEALHDKVTEDLIRHLRSSGLIKYTEDTKVSENSSGIIKYYTTVHARLVVGVQKNI